MQPDTQIKFRVTVWQPYFSQRMLAYGVELPQELALLGRDVELQREMFTWPVLEDVWAGVIDDNARATLSERFINEFQPNLLPHVRSMAAFSAIVEEIGAVANSGASAWSSSESRASELGSTPVMLNALLAFHQQLAWILETFQDVPGASVSVR